MKLSAVFFLLAFFFGCIQADESLFVNDDAYDSTSYGLYPLQTYLSTSIASPRLNILQSSPECDTALLTIFSPRGSAVQAAAMILDSDEHLVWTLSGYDQIYNILVQEYLGERYLTFWAGNDAVGGHGAGYYYMVSVFNFDLRQQTKICSAGYII